jgi:hypothetical protein
MKLISDVASVIVNKEEDGYVGLVRMAGMVVTVVATELEIVKELSLDAARLLWLKSGSAVIPESLVEPIWVEALPEIPVRTVH